MICGIGGQDGAYLAQLLLSKGYDEVGTSRDATMVSQNGLRALGIESRVNVLSMANNDLRSVLQTLTRANADEICNLAGQTSGFLSFEQPVEAIESIATGTLNLLEALRFLGCPTRFYNAGSCECFGNTGAKVADENTPLRPHSP